MGFRTWPDRNPASPLSGTDREPTRPKVQPEPRRGQVVLAPDPDAEQGRTGGSRWVAVIPVWVRSCWLHIQESHQVQTVQAWRDPFRSPKVHANLSHLSCSLIIPIEKSLDSDILFDKGNITNYFNEIIFECKSSHLNIQP
jgi:hypothetical protein